MKGRAWERERDPEREEGGDRDSWGEGDITFFWFLGRIRRWHWTRVGAPGSAQELPLGSLLSAGRRREGLVHGPEPRLVGDGAEQAQQDQTNDDCHLDVLDAFGLRCRGEREVVFRLLVIGAGAACVAAGGVERGTRKTRRKETGKSQ